MDEDQERGDTVRLIIETERCITGGMCEMLEPDMFLVDDDEAIAKIINGGRLPLDRARAVIDRCPGQAIRIDEETQK